MKIIFLIITTILSSGDKIKSINYMPSMEACNVAKKLVNDPENSECVEVVLPKKEHKPHPYLRKDIKKPTI